MPMQYDVVERWGPAPPMSRRNLAAQSQFLEGGAVAARVVNMSIAGPDYPDIDRLPNRTKMGIQRPALAPFLVARKG